MKIIEFLQKIGILRFGAEAGTYSSAKDAPNGLVTDVYKSKKDSGKKENTENPSTWAVPFAPEGDPKVEHQRQKRPGFVPAFKLQVGDALD